MRKGFYCIIIISIIFVVNSCNKKIIQPGEDKAEKTEKVVGPRFMQLYPDFSKDKLKSNLLSYLKTDTTLLPFYQTNDYSPVWINDTLNLTKLNSIVSILDNVEQHGLSKDMFKKDMIQKLALSIDSGNVSQDSLYSKLIQLDYTITSSIIKYITGMNYGFISPNVLLDEELNGIKALTPDTVFIHQLYIDIIKNPATAMFKSLPTDSVYLKMQEDYSYWKNKVDSNATKIKEKDNKAVYKIGEENKNITAIAERLMWTGEYEPDPTSTDSLHQTLSKELMSAVNTFRYRNSYPEETEVGTLTIDALNRPAEYYLAKLAANMERYRWKKANNKREKKDVEVNVASFMLTATQPGAAPLSMRVCVGNPRHKTPLLQSVFSYINLNPIWNVPQSIAKNEVFPLQRRDTSYLRKHNMRLYKGGEEIDYTTIDWKKDRVSEKAYYVRQDPGNFNSLGRLKFMFNNKYSVYLHDTPAKRAFTRKNRAVSHGCIRLQQPIDFAFFCLSPTASDDYKDRLLYSIDQRPRALKNRKLAENGELEKIGDIINLKDRISLTVDYKTVYMLPGDNTLYYADDVYGYDDLILNTLAINHIEDKTSEKDNNLNDGVF